MLDLDPGRDYVPPSTDGPAPEVRPRQPADLVARAAVGPAGEDVAVPRRPGRRESFPSSPAARAFRRRHFPDASIGDWNDWRWQARHRLRTEADLERAFRLSPDERDAV